MKRPILMAACALVFTASTAFAQTAARPAPAAPAPPPAQATPRAVPPAPANPQPINVKVDVTITDQQGDAAPITRTVSVIASDGSLGRVRSSATVFGQNRDVPLDIDAMPSILKDGHIKLQFTLSYDLPVNGDPGKMSVGQLTRMSLSNSVTLVLTDGKAVQVSQSADAVGSRKVTVEVKATILK